MSGSAHPGRKRPKKHEEEEHENHERWLVSYADMMTLLMCLFIVLFAMSQVDSKKFAQLASGLAESFGTPVAALTDSGASSDAGILDAMPAPVDVQNVAPPSEAPAQSEVDAAAAEAAAQQAARVQVEAKGAYDQLAAVRDQIDAAL